MAEMIVDKETNIDNNQVSFNQRQNDLEVQKKKEEEDKKNKRKSPFASFYQVNKENTAALINLINENPNAYKILIFLCDQMDNYNAVMCSYKVMEEYFNLSRQTLSTAVKVLKKLGFIYVYKSGTSNVYVVNHKVVWNSWGNNVEYCKFPANIVLSKTEQENKENMYVSERIKNVQIKKKK